MTSANDKILFDNLPEQMAPVQPLKIVPRLRTAERRQVKLRAVTLDDLIPEDHRVRLVWRFVEQLDLTSILATIKAVEGEAGHPAADPRILMGLWLFATIEGIASARELKRLCNDHAAYQWLCGGVSMNAKTLSDFRVNHGTTLERLLVDSYTALVRAGVANLDRIAQDGVRVRASAGAASFRRNSTLQECKNEVEKVVKDLRSKLNSDPGAGKRQKIAAQKRATEDRERRVREALAVTEELRAQQEKDARIKEEKMRVEAERAANKAAAGKTDVAKTDAKTEKRPKEPRASTTDPEARIMKMADGGFRPAFNVQFASDTKSGAIAGVSVDNVGSDMGKMAPMSDALAAHYEQRPSQHLVDGGFAKFADIIKLADDGVDVYAPVSKPRDPERDAYAALPTDPPAVAAWRERMGTDDAKAIYKERAQTAECANAQARNRGMTQFLVRGVEKVKTSALWYALAHNMACTWRLVWA
jgi:transposase